MKIKIDYKLLIIVCFVLQGCWWDGEPDDIITTNPSQYEPVIIKRELLESSIAIEGPKAIENSGKIYVKDELLFINEKNKGFHIFDNSNPDRPINIGFFNVLGSSDLTIKNNVIYINNATDLISITHNFESRIIEVAKRIPNTFPQLSSPDGFRHYGLEENDIIVDWILKN